MANFRIPESWTPGNVKLMPLNGPLANLFATTGFPLTSIPWVECVDDLGETDARFSSNQNSAAEVSYLTMAAAFVDTSIRPIILTNLLGGYVPSGVGSGADDKKFPPMRHPYYHELYAKDVVSVTSISPNDIVDKDGNQNLTYPYEGYDLVRVKVSYEGLGYDVCCGESSGSCSTPAGSDGQALWAADQIQGTNSRITQLFGLYKLNRGGGNYWPIQLGLQLPRPEGMIRQTFYRVPLAWYNAALTTLIAAQGKINNASYLGFGAEKVLLDSYTQTPIWTDWWGYGVTNVTLNFLYVDWGWNNQPDPFAPGTLLPVVANDGSTKPFTAMNMGSLVTALSPIAKIVPCLPEVGG